MRTILEQISLLKAEKQGILGKIRSPETSASSGKYRLVKQLTKIEVICIREFQTTLQGKYALCVPVLIAPEFIPVSLLSPIASDLGITEGQTGQAISISGLFAVITSLFVADVTRQIDRKLVVSGFTLVLMLIVSGVMITFAPTYPLMTGRALLGVAIDGLWSMATLIVMRLVPKQGLAMRFLSCGAAGPVRTLHLSATLLEGVAGMSVTALSLVLLAMGLSGVGGTWVISRLLENRLFGILAAIPLATATAAVALIALGGWPLPVSLLLLAWGLFGTAAPAGWGNWLSRTLPDDAEAGGGDPAGDHGWRDLVPLAILITAMAVTATDTCPSPSRSLRRQRRWCCPRSAR